MTGKKCKSCGSSDLEVDASRGDTVCTNCGTVLEDSAIVSEIQFDSNAHGVASIAGQFVSSESSGGCRGFGNAFYGTSNRESRDITLKNARRSINLLSEQLRLNQHCQDTAFNFYKMALNQHLTRGRKHTHIVAACVYITCRIEGTPHLLIDLSDVLQICAFELGRTYIRLAQALCINVPSLDPCLYVLRFASRLQFAEKTHEVSMTALRLVQRMKKDSIHYGRRPSGVCGAALLMAARLHNFSRTVGDIIKVVQVHESTLRKRLVEFGETPSSSLTLQEFMTVDLEEDQDPPSYKAARAKDRERLKMLENRDQQQQLVQLQAEIEKRLVNRRKKKLGLILSEAADDDDDEIDGIVSESTLDILEELEEEGEIDLQELLGIGPTIVSMGLEERDKRSLLTDMGREEFKYECNGELDLEGLDDKELDNYIMTDDETRRKDDMWTKHNADYLKAQEEKAAKLQKEMEEGKPPPEKKKKRPSKKKNTPANSAGEAIEKMLQEKRLSSKINYDVLKSLINQTNLEETTKPQELPPPPVEHDFVKPQLPSAPHSRNPVSKTKVEETPEIKEEYQTLDVLDDGDMDDYDGEEREEGEGVMSLAQMLNQHHNEENYYCDEDDYE